MHVSRLLPIVNVLKSSFMFKIVGESFMALTPNNFHAQIFGTKFKNVITDQEQGINWNIHLLIHIRSW